MGPCLVAYKQAWSNTLLKLRELEIMLLSLESCAICSGCGWDNHLICTAAETAPQDMHPKSIEFHNWPNTEHVPKKRVCMWGREHIMACTVWLCLCVQRLLCNTRSLTVIWPSAPYICLHIAAVLGSSLGREVEGALEHPFSWILGREHSHTCRCNARLLE